MMPTVEIWNPLIRKKAFHVYRSFNGNVEYDDCLQQGYEIFCKALHSFDPNKGAAFGTWLYWQLEGLRKEIVNSQILPGNSEALNYLIEPTPLWKEIVFLSSDAQFLIKLLLERKLHRQTSGAGRILPGEKTVKKYMRINHKWKKNRSLRVWNELKIWYCNIK